MRIIAPCGFLVLALVVGECRADAFSVSVARRMADRVAAEPRHLQSIDQATLDQALAWRDRSIVRLQSLVSDSSGSDPLRALREQSDLSELVRRLKEDLPDPTFMERFEEHARAAVLNVSLLAAARVADASARSYAAMLHVRSHPDAAQQELIRKLATLEDLLREYDATASPKEQIAKIHEVVVWLRLHRQAWKLTECLRAHYLRPKLRVYVSAAIMNDVAAIDLPSSSLDRAEGRFRICGSATTAAKIRVATIPNADYADLELCLRGPVAFAATAQGRRAALTVQGELHADVSKRFFVLQDLPCAAPATSDLNLLWACTDRGALMDAVVRAVVRRNVEGGRVPTEIESEIDRTAAELAGLVNFRDALRIQEWHKSCGFLTERRYRTENEGAEFHLLSSKDGVARRLELPERESGEDFCFSVHWSVLELLQPKPADGSGLRPLHDLVVQAFEANNRFLENAAIKGIVLSIAEKAPLVSYDQGCLEIRFRARDTGQPGTQAFRCTIRIPPDRIAAGFSFRPGLPGSVGILEKAIQIEGDGPQDDKTRRDFARKLLEEIVGAANALGVNLHQVAAVQKERADKKGWGRLRGLQLSRIDVNPEYLTIGARLGPVK